MQTDSTTVLLHDHGLVGEKGALQVLQKLEENPLCERVIISHNSLGDRGVQVLCEGLVKLRTRGHRGVTELNLASNDVSDRGMLSIITSLLLPTASPKLQPTLHSLYLSANKINLADKVVAALLATSLSHPPSSLHFLSLTSAPSIQLDHFLSLCYPTSLRCLLLNVCNIRHAKGLINFLSNPDQGGRLEVLELNGNNLGTRNVRKLAQLVISGQNTSLLRLELSANARSDDPSSPTSSRSNSVSDSSDSDLDQPSLRNALIRNRDRLKATTKAAFRLLCVSRIVLLGAEKAIEPLSLDDVYAHLERSTEKMEALQMMDFFPFKRLPNELQYSILRCVAQLDWPAVQSLDLELPLHTSCSPLTEAQFLKVVHTSEDRADMKRQHEKGRLQSGDAWNAAQKDGCLMKMSCARWERTLA